MSDEEIRRAVEKDPDAFLRDDDWFANAMVEDKVSEWKDSFTERNGHGCLLLPRSLFSSWTFAMTKNMGSFDCMLRVGAALVVGILYLAGQISGLTAGRLGAIALIFILTSAVGTCPPYMPFGLSTRSGQGAGA